VEAVAAPLAPAASSTKSNPFGDAKPITEEERERRYQALKVIPASSKAHAFALGLALSQTLFLVPPQPFW
jgi:hypothetical protein